eukprot:g4417.t1
MFSISLKKSDFKFNAAHFCAHGSSKEKLHGHNYRVGIVLKAERMGEDGYVMDFREVKAGVRKICKALDERCLLPKLHKEMSISYIQESKLAESLGLSPKRLSSRMSVILQCRDGQVYTFPEEDVVLLPIEHTSVEMLAEYLWKEIAAFLAPNSSAQLRTPHNLRVTVSETEGQEASFSKDLVWPEIMTTSTSPDRTAANGEDRSSKRQRRT